MIADEADHSGEVCANSCLLGIYRGCGHEKNPIARYFDDTLLRPFLKYPLMGINLD